MRIYLYHTPSISKLKGVGLKNLLIDSHLGLAMVGAEPLLQRSAVHNTNSYPPPWMDEHILTRQQTSLRLKDHNFWSQLQLEQLLVLWKLTTKNITHPIIKATTYISIKLWAFRVSSYILRGNRDTFIKILIIFTHQIRYEQAYIF